MFDLSLLDIGVSSPIGEEKVEEGEVLNLNQVEGVRDG
jgi:hypothetical protein